MTATNHALAGATIGLAITQPAVALPLAFVSHFVLDAVPHFGGLHYYESEKKRRLFNLYLMIDATLLAILMTVLFFAGAGWLTFICLFLAGSPDFAWAYRYVFQEKTGKLKPKPMNRFNQFHKRIQWSETPKGLFVEIPFAVILLFLVINLL